MKVILIATLVTLISGTFPVSGEDQGDALLQQPLSKTNKEDTLGKLRSEERFGLISGTIGAIAGYNYHKKRQERKLNENGGVYIFPEKLPYGPDGPPASVPIPPGHNKPSRKDGSLEQYQTYQDYVGQNPYDPSYGRDPPRSTHNDPRYRVGSHSGGSMSTNHKHAGNYRNRRTGLDDHDYQTYGDIPDDHSYESRSSSGRIRTGNRDSHDDQYYGSHPRDYGQTRSPSLTSSKLSKHGYREGSLGDRSHGLSRHGFNDHDYPYASQGIHGLDAGHEDPYFSDDSDNHSHESHSSTGRTGSGNRESHYYGRHARGSGQHGSMESLDDAAYDNTRSGTKHDLKSSHYYESPASSRPLGRDVRFHNNFDDSDHDNDSSADYYPSSVSSGGHSQSMYGFNKLDTSKQRHY